MSHPATAIMGSPGIAGTIVPAKPAAMRMIADVQTTSDIQSMFESHSM